mmetsp:Transcript_13560/g.13143  ORF Transcript_13560/g.13143 Transcript_13560/m.13143 type:complete len:277 (-) Transcript_13560:56-886(-)|eukprot:CAMPEP_0197832066 /NCGR_PEP_ID=MMETSP1437-20131217/13142_1 /TAXON_ID=49252 ORGANISM="Eucampia antarctica, Strain CCMP1452" /NCGR_SAMPLE_ID=MMETSP1437 /ASSEMBLY_ACC=CAM_ASM_001096 /LENGTH=276 /DNA_ID=CAMNT_0043435245 /DNA_START=25 /DNA_END=855 /DNA_ORIENTATION=+
MSLISTLSRRFGQVGLRPNNANLTSAAFKSKAVPITTRSSNVAVCRFMSSDDGKKKGSSKKDMDAVTNTQHEEWVKFQRTIKIDGFETGQTTTVTTAALLGRKDRGGKSLRKRKQKEQELTSKVADRERMLADLGGGEFPTLNFSDQETERLLKEGYATLPPRAGPRRTRHLRRERLRWEHKRENDAKAKESKVKTHFRRMEKRSENIKAVMAVKEGAEEIRIKDRAYQQQVLLKYKQIMAATTTSSSHDQKDDINTSTASNLEANDVQQQQNNVA